MFTVTPTVLTALRVNAGSIYSMSFGFRAGVDLPQGNEDHEPPDPVVAAVGPEVSLLSFRFGAMRDKELESWQAVYLPVGSDYTKVSFNAGLTLRYLFLD